MNQKPIIRSKELDRNLRIAQGCAFASGALCALGIVALAELTLRALDRDDYAQSAVALTPAEATCGDTQDDAAPDGTLPGTQCPNEIEWTPWCGCSRPLYGDDC